jgi:hypothetical protein
MRQTAEQVVGNHNKSGTGTEHSARTNQSDVLIRKSIENSKVYNSLFDKSLQSRMMHAILDIEPRHVRNDIEERRKILLSHQML